MDATDRKIRRFMLGPLGRRPLSRPDPRFYLEALQRLDERALGESTLRQLHGVIASLRQTKGAKNWKDTVRAKADVALAKALYASRRINQSQYVFFAVAPVEMVHEARIVDGYYKAELQPIEEAIEKIEREHGLEPTQYWARDEGPKEWKRLNKQFDDIAHAKFRETLKEFGLDDILAILIKSPSEFDQRRERGRRSVFHKEEHALVIQDIVIQYENDARHAATVGAFTAAVTSLGAAVEGLLLLRCLRSSRKAASVAKALPKRLRPQSPSDPNTWRFETLIEVCLGAGWLRPVKSSIATYTTASMAHVLRLMRNYVHPGKLARERPWSTIDEQEYRDAEAIYVLLASTLRNSPRQKRGQKSVA
jgi:hypothetical protein